jgi:hypothetical protein
MLTPKLTVTSSIEPTLLDKTWTLPAIATGGLFGGLISSYFGGKTDSGTLVVAPNGNDLTEKLILSGSIPLLSHLVPSLSAEQALPAELASIAKAIDPNGVSLGVTLELVAS